MDNKIIQDQMLKDRMERRKNELARKEVERALKVAAKLPTKTGRWLADKVGVDADYTPADYGLPEQDPRNEI